MKVIPTQNTARRRKAKKASTTLRPILRIATVSLVLIFRIGLSFSQNSGTNTSDGAGILAFLDQALNWYRQIDVERQVATEPDDVIAANENRSLADDIVRLAFVFARTEADSTAQASTGTAQAQNPEGGRYQSLLQLAANLDQQVKQGQAELLSDRQKLEGLTGKKSRDLQATIGELQSEIDLASARRDIVRNMADFVGGSSSGMGTSSLRGQIDALARSVPPELAGLSTVASSNPPGNLPSAPAVSVSKPEPSGIWGLSADLFLS